MTFRGTILGAVAGLALVLGTAQAAEVVVFAAASTTDALTEVGQGFTAATGHTVVASFASSSTLAKQIEQGAPAQLFVSANEKWADYLEEKSLLTAGSRTSLLGNSVVLIAPRAAPVEAVTISKDFDLVGALGGGRLSVGDPDHVPAGIYAKQALTSLGLWTAAEPHLARMNDVRAALALVERDETPLGIVYSTDAAASSGVKVIGTFPADSHDAVSYPVALVAGNETDAARALLAYLVTPEAKAVFVRHGFTVK